MDGSEADAYAELPAQITELGARLQVQADPALAKELAHLLDEAPWVSRRLGGLGSQAAVA